MKGVSKSSWQPCPSTPGCSKCQGMPGSSVHPEPGPAQENGGPVVDLLKEDPAIGQYTLPSPPRASFWGAGASSQSEN